MKHRLLSVAALVLAAGMAQQNAGAQMIIPFIGGGPAWGSGDISDAGSEMGWMGFAGVDYTLAAMPGATIGASAIYAHIPYKGAAENATNIPGVFADVGYLFGATSASRIKPYIRGGIGVMQRRYDAGNNTSYANEDSETKLGGAIGAGINFVMGSISPFVGAHFITGGSDTQFYTAYVGLSFGGAPATAAKRLFRR